TLNPMWLIILNGIIYNLTSEATACLLLLLLVCFLSGSRWVLSYKILFLIPSLAVLPGFLFTKCWFLIVTTINPSHK
uniref:Uncharacterized protein n=1 Tax=Neovison vison TaxID=452646 RepID=A0A8C7BF87_NEOVI